MPDVHLLISKYPQSWAFLADEGYQGIQGMLQETGPKKEACKWPSVTIRCSIDENVSSDRIVVEIFFGRLCGLWKLPSSKWRWAESI